MPAKRKGTAGADDRPSKRSTSGIATPQSIDSDDDFSLSSGADDDEDIGRAVKAFSLPSIKFPSKGDDGQSAGHTDGQALSLKPDHQNRPLMISADGRIFLESFSPLAPFAQDFLTSIAEPVSRPAHIHEYSITPNSLYAALSVGLTPTDIINGLSRFSKTPLLNSIRSFIQTNTSHFGKVKLVLKHNQYYLETTDAGVLQYLLKDAEIQKMGLQASDIVTEAARASGPIVIQGTSDAAKNRQATESQNNQGDTANGETGPTGPSNDEILEALRAEDEDDDEEVEQRVHSVAIPKDQVEQFTKRCMIINYPLLEEYDFNNDQVNPKLEIDLKPGTRIRDYQEKSLAKMFGNGRARSGIIVLPCGAGKTLVGVTAACTVRHSVIVLCTSEMSVIQWRNEFLKWSNIDPDDIAVFTAGSKRAFSRKAGIIVATYHMVTFSAKKRAHESQKMMDFLQQREWGLMLLDEVHVVPAEIFRKVGTAISAHCKLGLTATLLREDNKIEDLNFLIGPKLYEANWMELSNQGHIARVQCAEVWCPMTAEFYQEYLRESSRKRGLLYVMNPRKLQACQFLIDYHEKRGDKIIVFSDNVYALERYAVKLGKLFIYGETPQHERMQILENFQNNPDVNTIFLSKIGDTSLDLPEATCLIQVSSHYASRRQEAQRLGRILRAKRRNDEGFNAFFYSLVSKDTTEMYYSSKRQAFLVDQGYAFKVITHLHGIENMPNLAYSTPQEQRELLQEVLLQNETSADAERIGGDLFSMAGSGRFSNSKKTIRRQAGALSDLSGGQDMAYIEYGRSANKDLKGKKGRTLADRLKAQSGRDKQRRSELMK